MKRAACMHGMFLTSFVTFEILFVIKALRVWAALSAPEKEHESWILYSDVELTDVIWENSTIIWPRVCGLLIHTVRSRSAAASAAMSPVNAVWISSVAAARTEGTDDRTARMAFTGVTWDQDGRNLTPWPFEWFQNKRLSVYVLCVQRGLLFNERAVSRLGVDKQVHTLCALGKLARGLWIRVNRVLQGTANHRWRQ